MKNTQEAIALVHKTVETVVDALNRQVKQIIRLVTKQPKKPPLSWESIIGEDAYHKKHAHAVSKSANLPELPELNQLLAELPPDIFNELLRRIQMNLIDEIQAIRLYEKLFECEVQILRGHVHFYKCSTQKDFETIDYTTLTSRLTQLFLEHKAIIGRALG